LRGERIADPGLRHERELDDRLVPQMRGVELLRALDAIFGRERLAAELEPACLGLRRQRMRGMLDHDDAIRGRARTRFCDPELRGADVARAARIVAPDQLAVRLRGARLVAGFPRTIGETPRHLARERRALHLRELVECLLRDCWLAVAQRDHSAQPQRVVGRDELLVVERSEELLGVGEVVILVGSVCLAELLGVHPVGLRDRRGQNHKENQRSHQAYEYSVFVV
jgi:hypothetical protein